MRDYLTCTGIPAVAGVSRTRCTGTPARRHCMSHDPVRASRRECRTVVLIACAQSTPVVSPGGAVAEGPLHHRDLGIFQAR